MYLQKYEPVGTTSQKWYTIIQPFQRTIANFLSTPLINPDKRILRIMTTVARQHLAKRQFSQRTLSILFCLVFFLVDYLSSTERGTTIAICD